MGALVSLRATEHSPPSNTVRQRHEAHGTLKYAGRRAVPRHGAGQDR